MVLFIRMEFIQPFGVVRSTRLLGFRSQVAIEKGLGFLPSTALIHPPEQGLSRHVGASAK
jgi:hypothetical protein